MGAMGDAGAGASACIADIGPMGIMGDIGIMLGNGDMNMGKAGAKKGNPPKNGFWAMRDYSICGKPSAGTGVTSTDTWEE
jgi:hypothetical protein